MNSISHTFLAAALGSCLIWLSAPARHAAAAAEPFGDEFQVNSYTTYEQWRPDVAHLPDGRFIVVWQSGGSFGNDNVHPSGNSVEGRIFAANGDPEGEQFQVNTFTTWAQRRPVVATSESGEFVVVWHSSDSATDHYNYSIQGQCFDSGGGPVGDEFQLNAYTTWDQKYPRIAMAPDGRFVAVWTSEGSYGTDDLVYPRTGSVQARRFDADCSPVGVEFQVNTYTTGEQRATGVAMSDVGDFVVVWQSAESDGDSFGDSIHGARFSSDGSKLGDDFQVNSTTDFDQRFGTVAIAPDGQFLVFWSTYLSFEEGYDILGQRFGADGAPVGGEFRVNSYTTASQQQSWVSIGAQGMILVWEEQPSHPFETRDGSHEAMVARVFDFDGTPIGDDFIINSYTASHQHQGRVSMAPSGDWVAVWTSRGSFGDDTDATSVQARRFACPTCIFDDGFESGSTTMWSDAVGSP